MKSFFKKLFTPRNTNVALLGSVIGLSLVAWYYSYSNDLVLVYNDAMSHLNMARLVFDNQKPGLAQIGSVWLPFGHITKLALIWNNWAWHSGFAGSIVSMISYVATVTGIFGITRALTAKRSAAIVAGITAALNLNMLYLQSTPLTEPLFVALFTGSAYFLIKYLKSSDLRYLLPLALLTALQIATRYDGWFVMGITGLILLVHEMKGRGLPFVKAISQTALYATPVLFACLLWFGWNAIIFGDPLYFATGEFSAKAQQDVIESQAGLATKGNMLVSSQTYGYDIAENIGWFVLCTSLFGWLLFLNPRNQKHILLRLGALLFLGSVAIFNVLSLYLGFSTINIPQMNWDPHFGELLFNVRYGVLVLPFAAVGMGFLAAKRRVFVPIAILVIVAQAGLMAAEKPIVLRDGQSGSSAFIQQKISDELRENVDSDDEVLISMYNYKPVTFASKLPLRQFIHEGVDYRWDDALRNPQNHAEWVVMGNTDADPVYRDLVERGENNFKKYYQLVYKDQHNLLYRLNTATAAQN